MNYFRNIRTEKSASERYRSLAMLHHPDKGGDENVMKEINAQYRALCQRFEAAKARRRAEEPDPTKDTAHDEKTAQSANMKAENPPSGDKSAPTPERASKVHAREFMDRAEDKIADIAATAFSQIADVVVDEAASYFKRKIREGLGR